MRRWDRLAVAGAIVVTGLWAGDAYGAATPATTTPATQPAGGGTHVVKKGQLNLDITGEGVFAAVEPALVRLKLKAYAGPLTVVSAAAPWSTVKKGDSLLELERQEIKWAVEQAETAAETARAAFRKAELDQELGQKADALALRIQEDAVKNAEAAVKWFETVDGPQMLKQLELQVKNIKDSVEDQNDELDQLRKMYNSEELTTATSDIVIKRSVRRLDQTRIVQQMTEQRADKMKNNEYPIAKQRVLDAQEQARQALAMLKLTQETGAVARKGGLVAARIAKEQAENKLKDIREDLALFSVKSPADGVVAYGQVVDGAWQGGDPKAFKPGEKLAAGATVMRVINPGKLDVEMSLTEAQAFWLEAGAKARVTPAAFPTLSYEGTASAPTVAPKASALGFVVTVALPQTDPRLLPGMKAQVKIEGQKKDAVLLVPLSAVADGKVTVKKDGKTEEKAVKLGRSDGANAEVVSGLNEGDEVVVKK